MTHKDLYGSKVLLVSFDLAQLFKADNTFQCSQLSYRWRVLDHYLKSAQENSVYKEPCVLKGK